MEVARTGLFATPGQRALPEIVMASSPGYAEVHRPQVAILSLYHNVTFRIVSNTSAIQFTVLLKRDYCVRIIILVLCSSYRLFMLT